MRGKIIKGVGGFYYVHHQEEDTGRSAVYACRARGIFRKQKIKPLPGDNVEFSLTKAQDVEGSVDDILPRKNTLIRPAVANIDQAMVIFASASPRPNFNLLDRFLIHMRRQEIPVVICFNKTDLVTDTCVEKYLGIYRESGNQVLAISVEQSKGLEEVRSLLRGKTTVVAGPSGVGKSSLTNRLQSAVSMDVGNVSRKIDRGKHTTRHTQLVWVGEDTYFLDTPGFSSLYLPDLLPEELGSYYPEFEPFEPECRFQGCMHISEPDCAVKDALRNGRIPAERYENYLLLAEELRQNRRAVYK